MILNSINKLKMRIILNSVWVFTLLCVLISCDRTPSPPAVTAMNPSSGYYMTEVTVTGTGFSSQAGSNSVTVNNVECEITSASSTSVTFRIPALTEGAWPVKVITEAGEATAGMFNYQYTVYVAGCENNSSNINVAKYWKNEAGVGLTDGTENTILWALALGTNDVWTAGVEFSQPFKGKYWRNGTQYSFSTASGSGAYDIITNGNDVYVAGYESNGTKDVAKFWKNGTPVSLTNGATDACSYSLAVSGADLYVAGIEVKGTKPVATYWKNSSPVYLTDGTYSARASDIVIAGGDVFVCGYERNAGNVNVAKYWKNGAAVNLSNGQSTAYALSMAVKDDDIHVVGSDGSGACYWKNGTPVTIDCTPEVTTFASVFLIGSDIFIAGSERQNNVDHACYWRNGVKVQLTDGTKLSVAHDILVI